MKVRTTSGNYANLSPLQTKIALHCITHESISHNSFSKCMKCKYDHTCTVDCFIPLGTTPNCAIFPKNFNARICTNNYRKLHNLPKKRKGVDYFD